MLARGSVPGESPRRPLTAHCLTSQWCETTSRDSHAPSRALGPPPLVSHRSLLTTCATILIAMRFPTVIPFTAHMSDMDVVSAVPYITARPEVRRESALIVPRTHKAQKYLRDANTRVQPRAHARAPRHNRVCAALTAHPFALLSWTTKLLPCCHPPPIWACQARHAASMYAPRICQMPITP